MVSILFRELGDLHGDQSERDLHVEKVPGRPMKSHVSTRLTLPRTKFERIHTVQYGKYSMVIWSIVAVYSHG